MKLSQLQGTTKEKQGLCQQELTAKLEILIVLPLG